MIASFILPGGAFSSGAGFAVYADTYSDGDTFEYGYYPQSLVTDEDTLSALSALAVTPVSFGFYSGSGSRYDGSMAASDLMTYADAELDGGRYRLVRINSYRPYVTGLAAGTDGTDSYQDDNGYELSTDYWFKYEPVIWKVINASDGLVISENVLDSQAFNNFAYFDSYASDAKYAYYGISNKAYLCCNYAESSVRAWLTGDFASAALNSDELANASETELDNSGYLTLGGSSGYTRLDAPSTEDRIFLLSSADVADGVNGFDGIESRLAYPTDYAKCMGVYAYKYTGSGSSGSTYGVYDGVSPWLLRTAGTNSNYVCCVTNGGSVKEETYIASAAYCGIRPAMKLADLNSYRISYDANGGEGAPEAQTKIASSPMTITDITPVKEPYSFVGWSLDSTATEAQYTAGGEFDINDNITLYAVYGDITAPEAETSAVSDDFAGTQTVSFTFSDDIALSGCYFGTNETVAENAFTENTTGQAQYTVSSAGTYYFAASDTSGNLSEPVTLTFCETSFDTDGGTPGISPVITLEGNSFDLPFVSKTDFTFLGWSQTQGSESAEYAAGASYTVSDSKALYAVWRDDTVPVEYTLTYNANGGSNAPASQTGNGEMTLSSSEPVKEGWIFKGWSETDTATSASYQPSGSYNLISDAVLYAVWEEVIVPAEYKLTYNANGGSNAPASRTGNGEITLSSSEPVREGYTFKGWSESDTATSASYQPSGSYNLTSDAILYAVWEKVIAPVEYTLTYNANGGSNAPAGQTGNGQITLSSTMPVRDGYIFKGWALSAGAVAAAYQPSAVFTLSENTVLYAVWGQNVAVSIRNYTESRTEDYKATITFHAVTSGDTDGCTVKWYLNGNRAGTGESFTVSQATAGYTVQAKLVRNGAEISESGTETVNIKTGFFAKVIAFFRGLFGKLPVIDQ